MTSFIKWSLGVAIGLAMTGHLKSATLKMASMAVEAQKHQLSYVKFSRSLNSDDSGRFPRHRFRDPSRQQPRNSTR
jgi:hypothetical protein